MARTNDNGGPTSFITGYHAIEEYVRKSGNGLVLHAALKNRRILEITRLAAGSGIPVQWTDAKYLDSLPLAGAHRGLVLELRSAPLSRHATFEDFLAHPRGSGALLAALDGVTDVHNLGALVRSADLFGVDALIVPGRRNARDSDIVANISSGASAFVPLFEVTNLVRALEQMKKAGFWIYGADMDGQPAAQSGLNGNAVLVLGSEGKGLSRLVRETCDVLIRIPTRGHIDSLNVSVAGGILMYEIRRQQGWPGEELNHKGEK
ncbi:MAG: 23S rRNA (guanosine(2251)-2'-O)-methyltransferase RlmB [Spirochaetales bacterium]|jgi:23S rRNA (guanosine2251-2'-O)-methyltransferase|nr:23S rRNA (guanosine(2251)-2'-O)-methyltransferase RlmB [Spirochaetales bacterium]